MNRLFFVAVLAMLAQTDVQAQQTPCSDPPYMAHSSEFVMILFSLSASDVQPLLPKGVKAKTNENGLVTAGLEIYETDRVHGIQQYGMVFIFVEVTGLDSNNGTPGHWAIWGKVNEKNALGDMVCHFNFPYTYEAVEVKKEADIYTGAVGSGLITLKIKFNNERPFEGEGIVNMCSLSKDGKILRSEVPWFSSGSNGDVVGLEIKSNGDKVLDMVKNVKPFFSLVSSNQIFSYSRPVLE